MKKKLCALLLTVVMVFTMLPTVAFAAGESVKLDMSLSLSANIKAGETVTLTVRLSNCSPNLASFGFKVSYDKDKLTAGTPDVSGRPAGGIDMSNLNASTGEYAAAVMYSADVAAVADCTLLTLVFTAKSDVHGAAAFTMTEANFSFNNGLDALSTKNATKSQITGDWETPESVTIIKTPLTSASAVLSAPAKLTALDSTLDCADAAGYTGAVVWYEGSSASGTPLASGTNAKANTVYTAAMTLTPKTGDQESFATTGKVSVSVGTTAGASDVFAGQVTTGADGTLQFTHTFPATADKQADGITITEGTGLTVAVPEALPNAATEAELNLSAQRHYDDNSTDTASGVAWSIVGTAPTGVSVGAATGKLTVSNRATATSITVKAVMGALEDTADVTITRAAGVATAIRVVGDATVNAPVLADSPLTKTYTATVYDQYGASMTGTFVLTWSLLAPVPFGVSINASTGVVRVTSLAAATSFKVQAKLTGTEIKDEKTVAIAKNASVPATVTVGGGETTVAVPTLAEGNTATDPFTAQIKDQYGAAMTDVVSWSVVTADSQVSINAATGVLTVKPSASAGSVTVKGTASNNVSDTVTVTLTKEVATLTQLSVGGGVTAAAVPTRSVGEKEYTAFTVSGTDQYGLDMGTLPAVTWSIDGAAPTGVSIDSVTGALKVAYTASAGSVTVKATAAGKSDTKSVTITKATAAAESVEITDGPSAVAVPTLADSPYTSGGFTAEVRDQFDATMTNVPAVWSMDGTAPAGVSIDSATGALTITKDAAAGSVTVKVTAAGKTDTKSVTITKETATATNVKIYKSGAEITADSLVIPTAGTNTGSYTAKIFDQYGKEMSLTPAWDITPAGQGVDVSGGTVSVAVGAAEGSYALSAACSGKTATVTITVANKLDCSSAITFAPKTTAYGSSFTHTASITGVTGGTWTYTYSGTSYDGSYTGGTTLPTAAGSYSVTAKYENATHMGSKTTTLTISRKPLTISGVKATDRVYDGTTAVTLTGGTLAGNLDGANVGFTLGAGSITDKNAATARKVVTTDITLTGAKAANYTLTQPTDLTVLISKAPLEVTCSATLSRVYDGTRAWDGVIDLQVSGLAAGESGKLQAAGGTYNTKDVATANKLVLGAVSVVGNFLLSNYTYTLPQPAASITARPVAVRITGTAGPVKYGQSFSHGATAAVLTQDAATTCTVKYNNGAKPAAVNNYELTAVINNSNYSVASYSADSVTLFAIEKATPTITASKTETVRFNDTVTKLVYQAGIH